VPGSQFGRKAWSLGTLGDSTDKWNSFGKRCAVWTKPPARRTLRVQVTATFWEPRIHASERESEVVDDASPFDFRTPEVNQ